MTTTTSGTDVAPGPLEPVPDKSGPGAAGAGPTAGPPSRGAPAASRIALPAFVVLLGLGGFFFLPGHLHYAGSSALVAGLIGMGLYLPLAALRELPLNSGALTGLAAYLFSYLAADGGTVDHVAGIAVAVGVVTALSVFGGLASLVVTGLFFSVATLVIQVGVEKVLFSIPELTGGGGGRSVVQPDDLSPFLDTQRLIYLVVGCVCLALTAGVWILKRRRPLFRAVMAGWAPDGAAAVGLRRWTQKLGVFALSGVLIGIAGCLSAFVNGTPPPPMAFSVIWSVIFIAIPLAAGMRELSTIWLVAVAFTALPVALESYRIDPNLLSGMILLTAVLASQHRGTVSAAVRRLRGARTDEPEIVLTDHRRRSPRHEPLPGGRPVTRTLVTSGLAVDFGGIRALDGVGVRVAPGQRVAIVGANGAGKTTLFNAVTGFVPHAGTVRLGDRDLTGRPPHVRARAGLARTFQLPRVADILTVRQSVLCGHGGAEPAVAARADALLARFGLTGWADTPVAGVPFGVRRKVEMARALVGSPQVLMLDEPVSGLEDHEVSEVLDTLLELQAIEGWGLLVIEHDLRFVTGVAEYLMVMEAGQVLVEGPIHDVLADDRVRRVYLGEAVAV